MSLRFASEQLADLRHGTRLSIERARPLVRLGCHNSLEVHVSDPSTPKLPR